MVKHVGIAASMLSWMLLVGWFPAMTPDRKIEMQSYWGWSQVETDLGSDGIVDEILYCSYDRHGRLVRELWETPSFLDSIEYYYDAYGILEYEEWDYDDDGTIDEAYCYDYDPSGMLFRLRMDYDADGRDDAATYYYYDTAGRLAQKDSDYELDGTIDEVTEYIYDRHGKVIQANHSSTRSIWNDQTTHYYYNASGDIQRQEEDYEDDGLIDYISLYTYDGQGRPYREIDDDVNDYPETFYEDATRSFFYEVGSDGNHGDSGECWDCDGGCFISAAASDRALPLSASLLIVSGIVLLQCRKALVRSRG
ncbi:MAG TPA: hypothetical protein PLR71_10930 [Deltaproteobacteria bacterium]|nr:hypothetical protein [Deltaproteobacteria bacterium]HQI82055.1 hypothetical protein [Deltaproteobacteria bacterium]